MSAEVIAATRFGGDVAGAACFAIAAALVVLTPYQDDAKRGTAIKALTIALFAIYALVLTSGVLAKLGLPALSDLTEDNFEVLYPLVALGLVFAIYSAQQFADVMSSQRALAQTHDMMMEIMDGAPAGILFLDPDGRIVFANDTAQQILDLSEDAATGALSGPDWKAAEGLAPKDLSMLVAEEPYSDRALTLLWPDGWTVELLVSGSPKADSRGGLGGVVVTFERPRSLR